MLVLLPPSEGKAADGNGPAVDLASLSLPGLTTARATVLDELVGLCAGGDDDKAADVLGLSPGLRGEISRNAGLREARTRPAGEIYTGVLYDALGLGTLDATARRRAARSLLVFSGLWGAVGIRDAIPAYRCSMGVKLPGLGPLAAYWRPHLAEALPAAAEAAGGGLLLDLRSSAYGAAWKPAPRSALAGRTATVRVVQARTRKVVSHFNKATKGRIVRALLESGARPKDPDALVAALRDLGFTVEVAGPGRLDVLVTDVH
ncbi:peroxide stress protein YaaA [Streptomyces sp. ME03-5709C]|nr:peroxide stress protein YaaA [Streptomyces sp. ME03-5709C]